MSNDNRNETNDKSNRVAIMTALRQLSFAQAGLHNILTYPDTSMDNEINNKEFLLKEAEANIRTALGFTESVIIKPYKKDR